MARPLSKSTVLKRLELAAESDSTARRAAAIGQAFRYVEQHSDDAEAIIYALSAFGRDLYNPLRDELSTPNLNSAYAARLEQLGRLSGFFREMEQFLDGGDKRLINHLIDVLQNIRGDSAEFMLVDLVKNESHPASVRARALESLGKRDNPPCLDEVYEFVDDETSPLSRAALNYLMELVQIRPDEVFERISDLTSSKVKYVLEKVTLPKFPENLRLLLNVLVSKSAADMRAQTMIQEIVDDLGGEPDDTDTKASRNQLIAADLLGRHLRNVEELPVRVFLLRMILKLGNIGRSVLKDHIGQARKELRQELSDVFMRFPAGKSVDLLEMVLESLDTKQALKAVAYLKHIGSLQSVELLVKLISHAEEKVKKASQEAITGLINVNQIAVFLKNTEASVRITMLQILKLHANHKTTRDLVTPMLHDPVPDVRKKALLTLAYLGKERDPLPFLQAAAYDKDQNVRQCALDILKSVQTIYGNKTLADHMTHQDHKVAGVAARIMAMKAWQDFEKYALSQCDSAAELLATALQVDSEVRKHLVLGMTISNHKIRFTTAKVLAAISERPHLENIIRPLVLRALADPHPHVRATAVRAFQNLGHVRDSSKLIRLLNDADDRVRANVVEALGRFWNHKTRDAVAGMAGDPSPRVRANAAMIMAKRGTREGIKLIKKLLKSNDPQLKISGNYALQAVGGRLRS